MMSSLRALWRRSRSSRQLRPLLEAVDRLWWARAIRRADLVDLDLVAAQSVRRSSRAAIRAYVRGGFRTGLTLNPLLQERLVSGQLSDVGRVPALYAYLVNDRNRVELSVNWDARALACAELHPSDDPLSAVWQAAKQGRSVQLSGVNVPGDVLRARTTAAAALSRGTEPVALSSAFDRDMVALVRIGVAEDASDALRIAAELSEGDIGVVLALGANADQWVSAALLQLRLPQIHLVRDDTDVIRTVTAACRADAVLIVRSPEAEITADGLRQLAATAAHGVIAGPLWLDADTGTIVSAGTVSRSGVSYDLLRGHPPEDAANLDTSLAVPFLRSPTFAMRIGATSSVVRTDVPTRAPASTAEADVSPRPDSSIDVAKLLSPTSFAVQSWSAEGPVLVRRRRDVELPTGERVPSLRWAIKTAAPAGPRGEWWGDTHFARGVADALRRLGQEVVVDAYPARQRPSSHLDDVTLALRGPEPIHAARGAFSILWVISHPDEITVAEIEAYDEVFAASTLWAKHATRVFDRPVRPLLQCTDAHRFHPSSVTERSGLLFVGTARGIPRPSVIEPLKAGIPVAVYGPDWTGWIPAGSIRATGVPNAELPGMYERASAVLNDHWPAMRAAGFVSNRLFDVVGAGGRAISDEVSGIHELFEGAVLTYDTIPELLEILRSDLDEVFPPEDTLKRISARIREEHSFDARAHHLLRSVLTSRVGTG